MHDPPGSGDVHHRVLRASSPSNRVVAAPPCLLPALQQHCLWSLGHSVGHPAPRLATQRPRSATWPPLAAASSPPPTTSSTPSTPSSSTTYVTTSTTTSLHASHAWSSSSYSSSSPTSSATTAALPCVRTAAFWQPAPPGLLAFGFLHPLPHCFYFVQHNHVASAAFDNCGLHRHLLLRRSAHRHRRQDLLYRSLRR